MAGSWDSWPKALRSCFFWINVNTLLLRRLSFLQFSSGVLPGESLGGTKQQGHLVEAEDMVGRVVLNAGPCWSKWLEASSRCRQM